MGILSHSSGEMGIALISCLVNVDNLGESMQASRETVQDNREVPDYPCSSDPCTGSTHPPLNLIITRGPSHRQPRIPGRRKLAFLGRENTVGKRCGQLSQ